LVHSSSKRLAKVPTQLLDSASECHHQTVKTPVGHQRNLHPRSTIIKHKYRDTRSSKMMLLLINIIEYEKITLSHQMSSREAAKCQTQKSYGSTDIGVNEEKTIIPPYYFHPQNSPGTRSNHSFMHFHPIKPLATK
jgi:hypothetical protein